jgi:large subunit ribosomal protein L31
MREGIHPSYVEATVVCACGSTFKTRSTKPMIRLDICSSCHPFFTGRQKFVDSAGRVERFQKRFAKTPGEAPKKAPVTKLAKGQPAALAKKKVKILSSAPIRTKPLSTTAVPKGAPKTAAPKPSAPKSH